MAQQPQTIQIVQPQAAQQEEEETSWWKKLWSWFPGFGGGDLFSMLFWLVILAVGGYALVSTKTGQGWIRDLFGPEALTGILTAAESIGLEIPGAAEAARDTLLSWNTADAAQKGLKSFTKNEAVIKALAPNDAEWVLNRKAIMKALGDHPKLTDLMGDQVMYTLITERKQAAIAIAKALASTSQADASMFKSAMQALNTMVQKPGTLRMLFSPNHIATTTEILETFLPVKFAPGTLRALIERVGREPMGGLTHEFGQLITQGVQAVATQPDKAMAIILNHSLNLLASPRARDPQNAAVVDAFIAGIRLPATQETAEQTQLLASNINQLLGNRTNREATLTLRAQLEAIKPGLFLSVMGLAGQPDKSELIKLMREHDGIRTSMQQWANAMDSRIGYDPHLAKGIELLRQLDAPSVRLLATIAPTGALKFDTDVPVAQLPILVQNRIFEMMLDPQKRAQLNLNELGASIEQMVAQGAGQKDKKLERALTWLAAKDGTGRYVNLQAINNFIGEVQAGIAAKATALQQQNLPEAQLTAELEKLKAQAQQTQDILFGFFQFAQGNPAVLRNQKPEAIAQFFADPVHKRATQQLLATMDISSLDASYQRLIGVVRQHWDNQPSTASFMGSGTNTHGFHEILSDPAAVSFMVSAFDSSSIGAYAEWSYKSWTNAAMWHNSGYLQKLSEAAAALNTPQVAPATPAAQSAAPLGIPLNTAGIRHDASFAGNAAVAPTPAAKPTTSPQQPTIH